MAASEHGQRPMTYAVVGVGAVGGYYGARLAAAGADVHWLARSDASHLREQGLLVESVAGDIRLTDLSVHTEARTVPPVDVVLLAAKTTAAGALAHVAAIVEASRAAGRQPAVVCLQNGLGVEEAVARVLPQGTAVLGGMCFICATKVGPGHVAHTDYGALALGEWNPDTGSAGRWRTDLAAAWQQAGVPADPVTDLQAGRWRKLVWNIPFNGLSVLLDARTDEVMGDKDAVALTEDVMVEVVAASEAVGHPVPREAVPEMLARTAGMRPYDTSMRLDYAAGRPLETQAIYWAPIEAAAQAGCAMPRTETLARQLGYLDRRSSG